MKMGMNFVANFIGVEGEGNENDKLKKADWVNLVHEFPKINEDNYKKFSRAFKKLTGFDVKTDYMKTSIKYVKDTSNYIEEENTMKNEVSKVLPNEQKWLYL